MQSKPVQSSLFGCMEALCIAGMCVQQGHIKDNEPAVNQDQPKVFQNVEEVSSVLNLYCTLVVQQLRKWCIKFEIFSVWDLTAETIGLPGGGIIPLCKEWGSYSLGSVANQKQ